MERKTSLMQWELVKLNIKNKTKYSLSNCSRWSHIELRCSRWGRNRNSGRNDGGKQGSQTWLGKCKRGSLEPPGSWACLSAQLCFWEYLHTLRSQSHQHEPVPGWAGSIRITVSRASCGPQKPGWLPNAHHLFPVSKDSSSSSNMLRVTTFSASWGNHPLHTAITHPAEAVSSHFLLALSPSPFANPWLEANCRHLGSLLKMATPREACLLSFFFS